MEITITLPKSFPEQTLRDLLEKEWLVPRKTRHFLRVRKNVEINGKTALFHHTVHPLDKITLHFEEEDYPKPKILAGQAEKIQVLFEDDHLIVLDKPAGMKTHPNQPDERDTLLNHLAAYLLPKGQTPYVVHRLDKETSGAILFAKNPFVLPILGRMLEKKQIYRRYQAIVAGHVRQSSWTIRKRIGRHRHDRRMRVIDPKKGDMAITHLEKAAFLSEKNQTTLYCVLETGRTHQIRVHLASESYPLIGDPLYNPKSTGRLMLHAYELHLSHPFTGEELVLTAEPGLW